MNEQINFDPKAIPYSSNMFKKTPVSLVLGFGIFFMPYVFSWLLLRSNKDYSRLAKIISFGWMSVLLLIFAIPKPLEKTEPQVLTDVAKITNTTAPPMPAQETPKINAQEVAFQKLFNEQTTQKKKALCAEVKTALTGLFKKGTYTQISVDTVEIRYADEYAQIPQRQKDQICLALSTNAICNNSPQGSVVQILGAGKGLIPDTCRQGQHSSY